MINSVSFINFWVTESHPDGPDLAVSLRFVGTLQTALALLIIVAGWFTRGGFVLGGAIAAVVGTLVVWLVRVGRLRAAAMLECWGLLLAAVVCSHAEPGSASPVWAALCLPSLMAGCLLGGGASFVLAAVATLNALLVYELPRLGASSAPDMAQGLLLVVALIWLSALAGRAIGRRCQRQSELVGASRAMLAAIFDGTTDLIWSVDPVEFRVLSYNSAMAGLMRARRGDMSPGGKRPLELFSNPERARRWERLYRRALAQGAFSIEYPLADGRVLLLSFNVMREGQRVLGISVLGKEITESKRVESELMRKGEELARARASLEQAQALAHLGSWRYDCAGSSMDCSLETYRIAGIEPGMAVTPQSLLRISHPDDLEALTSAWQATLGGKPFDLSHRLVVGARIKWVHSRAQVEFDAQGQPLVVVGTLQDITEQQGARERIEFLALHDALTGLPNRVRGQERLQQAVALALRHGGRLAVLNLDLDKFKFVNDTHGHAVGDKLLASVADRLRVCLRGEDTLCRLSGDEFMIVLPDLCDERQASSACERILSRLAEPFELDGIHLSTSFSIGVAFYPRDGGDVSTLMRHADMALYDAKRAGRNAYRCFELEMNASLLRYLEIRAGLGLALERGEFELHYQPQLSLGSGTLVGVEALLRWNRPGHGLVQPGDFIAAAEDSGLVVPIGRWVLGEACRQAAAWQAAGWDRFVVSVNLSMVQLRQGRLEGDVCAALDASGLDPTLLELELTETVLLEHDDAVMAALGRLNQRGVRFAIDDFGTGYSNLSYLKRINLDKLKIDRSFVQDLENDGGDQAIVRALSQIARHLTIRTVAEGVESSAVADRLREMGCDEAQGYLYSKPLPAARLEHWMRHDLQHCARLA